MNRISLSYLLICAWISQTLHGVESIPHSSYVHMHQEDHLSRARTYLTTHAVQQAVIQDISGGKTNDLYTASLYTDMQSGQVETYAILFGLTALTHLPTNTVCLRLAAAATPDELAWHAQLIDTTCTTYSFRSAVCHALCVCMFAAQSTPELVTHALIPLAQICAHTKFLRNVSDREHEEFIDDIVCSIKCTCRHSVHTPQIVEWTRIFITCLERLHKANT